MRSHRLPGVCKGLPSGGTVASTPVGSARTYESYALFQTTTQKADAASVGGIRRGRAGMERSEERSIIYEKLPSDIAKRHVLLLDPILATGNSAVEAINVLLTRGVPEQHIILVTLICAPKVPQPPPPPTPARPLPTPAANPRALCLWEVSSWLLVFV
jgi:predicted phosphoribosyltransferase